MENNKINIAKFRGNNSTSFTGRPEGKMAREELGINKYDGDKKNYLIIIPKGTTAFNPSFFLGFLFESIEKLGLEKFIKKYEIVVSENEKYKNRITRDIEEGLRHAKNQLEPKSGFFNFLK